MLQDNIDIWYKSLTTASQQQWVESARLARGMQAASHPATKCAQQTKASESDQIKPHLIIIIVNVS